MRRLAILAVLCFLFALMSGANAQAAEYAVAGFDNSTLGKAAYGTSGSNYVIKGPHPYVMHVSSFNVWDTANWGDFMAEIGWSWTHPDAKPKFFGACLYYGFYYDWDYSTAAVGTNHSYKVSYIGSRTWVWYLDGAEMDRYTLGSFTKGRSFVSSERNDIRETNYSHFWSLKKKSYPSGVWYAYSNLESDAYFTNDPVYYLYKVSNTEAIVQD